jgi:hypothetical protein
MNLLFMYFCILLSERTMKTLIVPRLGFGVCHIERDWALKLNPGTLFLAFLLVTKFLFSVLYVTERN